MTLVLETHCNTKLTTSQPASRHRLMCIMPDRSPTALISYSGSVGHVGTARHGQNTPKSLPPVKIEIVHLYQCPSDY